MSRFLCVLICLLMAVSGIALAQDAPKAEIFGGYQYLHATTGVNVPGLDNFNLNGWNASLTGYFHDYFGVAGDFSGSYGSPSVLGVGVSTKVYTYMFGPVVRYPNKSSLTPYGHVLFGGGHVSASALGVSVSDSGFAWAAGGGLDLKLGKPFAVRLAQFDYLQTRIGGTSQNNFRVSTGIVLRF